MFDYWQNHIISERRPRTVLRDEIFIVSRFDPLIQWTVGYGIFEVGTRGYFAFGFMYRRTFGSFSRIKKSFARIGRWTFYVNYGECEPYDPTAS
jgi:hypothetical protein